MRERGLRCRAGFAVVGACLGLLAIGSVPGGAKSRTPTPLPIRSSALTQSGRDFVWKVGLGKPFSPAALARAHGKLCLLLEKASNGRVKGEVCVASGRHHRPPARLIFSVPGTRHSRYIPASVVSHNARSLSVSFLPASVELHYRRMRWQTESAVAGSGCSTTSLRANPCVALLPRHPKFLKLHYPRLVGCVATGSNFVFHGPTNVHDIALTFDDGPWYDTPQFLSLLEREHVPATFFEIGDQISEYGQGGAIERRMLRDGDIIGDHTWTHPDVAGAGSFAASQISLAANAIKQATGGFYPCLFRAPYGDTSPALLSEVRSMGMTTIQWNIDPRDWSLPGVGEIEGNVLANATNGGIVEMHDGGGPRYETIDALPTIISTLRHRGFKFVTLTQMLGYRLIYK